jgi:hypothetical protein
MDDCSLSVVEARSLMPVITAKLSDSEVEDIINNLGILATSVIQAVRFDDEFRVNIEYNRGKESE